MKNTREEYLWRILLLKHILFFSADFQESIMFFFLCDSSINKLSFLFLSDVFLSVYSISIVRFICLRGLTSTNSRAMHVVPRHSSMRTSLSSTGVSCCTLLRQAMCALQFRCIVVASFSIWRWKRQKSADFDGTFRKS